MPVLSEGIFVKRVLDEASESPFLQADTLNKIGSKNNIYLFINVQVIANELIKAENDLIKLKSIFKYSHLIIIHR